MMLTEEKRLLLEKKLNNFRTKKANNECFGWNGALQDAGCPRISFNCLSLGANRAAWLAVHGSIPKKHFVRHSCKNKECTNIKHLYLSTKKFEGKAILDGKKKLHTESIESV